MDYILILVSTLFNSPAFRRTQRALKLSKAIFHKHNNFVSKLCSLINSAYWCRLLIAFANRLDADQARQNVGPDWDPNCLAFYSNDIPERIF